MGCYLHRYKCKNPCSSFQSNDHFPGKLILKIFKKVFISNMTGSMKNLELTAFPYFNRPPDYPKIENLVKAYIEVYFVQGGLFTAVSTILKEKSKFDRCSFFLTMK